MAGDIGAKVYLEGDKQFKTALRAINSEIKSNATMLKDLGSQYDKNDKKLSDYRKENEQLSKSIDSSKTKLKALSAEYERNTSKLKELEIALEKAKRENGENSDEAVKAENAYSRQSKAVSDLESQINTTNTQINQFTNQIRENANTLTYAGEKIHAAGEKISSIGDTLTTKVTAPALALGTLAVKSAMDFESAWAGVTKTVDGTKEQMQELKEGIISLSEDAVPASKEEIAAVAEAAGQLGIKTDKVLSFSKAMIDLGESTNMGAETAATELAKFANITNMSQSNFNRLGSTIVALGNNFATTESDISAMAMRLAAAGTQVGMSEPEIMALSAALSSVGIEAEAGGSSMSKVISQIQLAVETNKDSLVDYARVAGMSVEEFSAKFEEDALGAVFAFIGGLSDMERNGKSATQILDEMEIKEVRMTDALKRASGAKDLFNEAVKVGNTAWKENVALTNEANQRYATTESRMKMAKNSISNAATEWGNVLLPVIGDVATDLIGVAKQFGNVEDSTKKNIVQAVGFAAVLGPTTKVAGEFTKGLGDTIKYLGETGKGLKKGEDATTGLSKVIKGIKTPAGAAVTALTLLGTAAFAYYQYSQKIAREKDLEEHFGRVALSAAEVEKLATELTTNDWTIRLDTYIDAKSKLAESQKAIEESISDLNKYDWKVKAGFTVSAEESEAYKSSIDSYISQVQTYVQDKGYALNLAIDFGLGDTKTGAGLSNFVDIYFSESHAELKKLGAQLADLVNKSFEENTFAENRVEIEKIRQNMSNVIAEINRYEAEGERIKFEMQLDEDIGLTAESFSKVIEKTNEFRAEMKEKVEAANADARIAIAMQYDYLVESGIDQSTAEKIKQDAIRDLQINITEEDAENLVTGMNHLVNTIKTNYGVELEKVTPALKTDLQTVFRNISAETEGYAEQYGDGAWVAYFDRLKNEFSGGSEELSEATRKNLNDLLDKMSPQTADLQRLANQYIELGQTPPKYVIDGLTDAYRLEVLSGNTAHIYELMSIQMGNSPEYQEMIAKAIASGEKPPEGVAFGMQAKYGLVYDASTGLYKKIEEGANNTAPQVVAAMNKTNTLISSDIAKQLSAQYGVTYNAGKWLLLNTKEGAYSVLPEVMLAISNMGIEFPEEFISSMQGKEADVQNQVADLLLKVTDASDDERSNLIQQLKELGIDLSDEFIDSMIAKKGEMSKVAGEFTDKLQSEFDKKKINAPSINGTVLVNSGITAANKARSQMQSKLNSSLSSPSVSSSRIKSSGNSAAWTGWNAMQYVFNNNPISARVRVIGASSAGLAGLSVIRGYEYGGKVTEEQLAKVGEGNKPEYVIPVSAGKRSRGIELLQKAAADLNYPISTMATSRLNDYSDRTVADYQPSVQKVDMGGLNVSFSNVSINNMGDLKAVTKLVAEEVYEITNKTLRGRGL